jgi:iron(III) transport system substrate-binding protein
VDQAPHPQAAKLLVRWLLGDANGGQGYAPWYQPGLYAARTDLADPHEAVARQQLEPRLWEFDVAFAVEHRAQVRDYVAAHIGRPVGGR